MQKITPFLWFNENAEEAVNYYVSTFKNSKIKNTTRYGKDGAEVSGQKEGSVMTISFEIEGQEFNALNGGLVFSFTPAISFVVSCETQEEVDHLWEKLSADPQSEQCGWLKDKFGVSWQIIPTALQKLMSDPDPVKARRVMKAMLTMKKIDIQTLKNAYEGQ